MILAIPLSILWLVAAAVSLVVVRRHGLAR